MVTLALMLGMISMADVEWGTPQNGLSTRISLVTAEPTVGKTIKLKLEIKNVGTTPAKYDDQQASMNNSIEVKDSNGKPVPYVGMSAQTMGSDTTLAVGAANTIFADLDLAEQYLLETPGRYTVTFKSQLHGGLPRSNELTITLKDGPIPDRVKLTSAFYKAAPKGWRVARYGDDICFMYFSPTGLKADVATIGVFFTKDDKAGRDHSESLGKTKLGYAWVETIPREKAGERWPDYKKAIDEQLKSFR